MAAVELEQLPVEANITVWRGDGYVLPVRFKVPGSDPVEYVDVSGWEFSAQVRQYASAADVLASVGIDTSDAPNGNVVLTWVGDDTKNLPALELAWDFQRLVGDGDPRTLMAGTFTVKADTAR